MLSKAKPTRATWSTTTVTGRILNAKIQPLCASNTTGIHIHCAMWILPGSIDSICAPITFCLADQSSRNFYPERGRGCTWSRAFPIPDTWSIPRIFAVKIKVVWNRAKFCTFFSLQNFMGEGPPEVVPNCHACRAAHHVSKFHEVTLSTHKVINAHKLNFKQIFECSLLNCWGAPSPMGCALASRKN